MGLAVNYSEAFKARMVRRMTGPGALSATALSRDVGVTQPTLSRWVREAGSPVMSSDSDGRDSTARSTVKRPQDWSAEEKLTAVVEAAALSEEELGAYLRRKGVHQTQLEQWRTALLASLEGESAQKKRTSPEVRRIRELERDLLRKDRALAEATALLVLKKKLDALWADEDDDTPSRSGR